MVKKTVSDIEEQTLDPLKILIPDKKVEVDDFKVSFITADEYRINMGAIVESFPTGVPDLDSLISFNGKGFETGSVYLLFGMNATGKTQICNTMTCINPYDVVWIDGGENTFSPARLAQICEARGIEPKTALGKVHFVRAYNAMHLEAICTKMAEAFMVYDKESKMRKFRDRKLSTSKIGMVVLDSLAPLFRVQYSGIDNLNPRQASILRSIYALRVVSIWMNCTVLITNQMTLKMGGFHATYEPVGGPTVGHNVDTQIKLRFGDRKEAIRIASIMDSSYLPYGEAAFKIDTAGIVPLDDEEENTEDTRIPVAE